MTPLPAQLDGDRRSVLHELIALLTGVVAEAQVLTGAALDFDLVSLADASATLAQMSADPVLDLGRTTEVYRALRRAIVERQQARRVAPSVRSFLVAPQTAPDSGSWGPALRLAEAEVGHATALAKLCSVPMPPQPRLPAVPY